MAEAIVMPELGQTVSEGAIVEWFLKEGDAVEMGDPLLLVETDKTEVEVECVADGVLLRIVAPAGSRVEAGDVIAYVGEEGDEIPDS